MWKVRGLPDCFEPQILEPINFLHEAASALGGIFNSGPREKSAYDSRFERELKNR
jgi:hypothetical protein